MKSRCARRRAGIRLEKFVGIEENGDRAVVHDLDRHVRLKNARRDAYSQLPQSAHKFFIQRLALLRRRSVDKTGPALAAYVAVQRELRDSENRTARVQQRT